MSGSKFVSFSTMLKKRGKEEPPEVKEEHIDYQALYEAECTSKEQISAQVHQLEQEINTLKQQLQQQEQSFLEGKAVLEQSVQQWKREIHEQHILVWKSFVEKFFYDARYRSLAFQEILAQALLTMGEQKDVVVEVPSQQVDLMQALLQNHPTWEIVATDDIELGLRFKTEKIEWEDKLEPVYEEFMGALSQLLQDVR